MTTRKTIIFKLNNEVVCKDQRHLDLVEIVRLRALVAEEMECDYNDIVVEIEEATRELSDIDSTSEGLVYWKDLYPIPLTGVRLLVSPTSNKFLDNLKNIDEYLKLIY